MPSKACHVVPCLLRHAQLTCASPCLVPSKLTKKQKRAYRAFLNQDDILVGGGKQADLSVCLCPAPRAALNGAFFFLWLCLFRLRYTVQLIRMRDVPCPCGSSRPRIECCYAFQSRVSPRQCCGTVPHSTCMPFCPSADCRTADVGLSLLFSTDQHKQGRVCTCADDAPMRPFCGMCHCSISTYSGEGRPKGS